MRKRDLNYLVTFALLIAGGFTASTGLISDAWDLNEFVYHKYSAYLTAGLAALHLWLNGYRLVAYLRNRLALAKVYGQQKKATLAPNPATKPKSQGGRLNRRGFLGLILGTGGGFLLGRWSAPRQEARLAPGADIGEVYHQWSKPGYLSLLDTVLNWGRQPALYKEYAWAPKISLPPPSDREGLSLEEAIQHRRSVRDYSGQPMSLEELSRLLYYACGINETRWGLGLRAAPSAGALYPIEVYPVVHRVEGLVPGVYHYSYPDHALEQLQERDLQGALIQYGVGQEFLGQANVVLILTAIFQRTRWKYRERTYRYVMLEAGHIGENVYLAATSMGLGACAVGAFFDDDLNRLLGVDGIREAVVYLLAVGKVK
jgi:SagB-type dehydrogenase family enzyme